VEDEAAAWCRGVDALGQRSEPDAAPGQCRDGLDEVGQRAPEPVQLPNDQHLAVPHVVECSLQAFAVRAGAGGMILEHLGASSRRQRVELE
jgi:hypothetical protein